MYSSSSSFKMFNKRLHNLLLKAFHEALDDPIFKRVTINHVKLNRTKTFATVYLDLISAKDPNLVLQKLNRLNGLFKNYLDPYLGKYRIPFFKFVEDKVFEEAMKVDNLISDSLSNG